MPHIATCQNCRTPPKITFILLKSLSAAGEGCLVSRLQAVPSGVPQPETRKVNPMNPAQPSSPLFSHVLPFLERDGRAIGRSFGRLLSLFGRTYQEIVKASQGCQKYREFITTYYPSTINTQSINQVSQAKSRLFFNSVKPLSVLEFGAWLFSGVWTLVVGAFGRRELGNSHWTPPFTQITIPVIQQVFACEILKNRACKPFWGRLGSPLFFRDAGIGGRNRVNV